jgi:hypothetical protein
MDVTSPAPKKQRTAAEVAADARRSATMMKRRERERAQREVTRHSLRTLPSQLRKGTYPAWARPHLVDWEARTAAIVQDQGGLDLVPETKRTGLTLGLGLYVGFCGELERYLRTRDPEAAGRLATLSNALLKVLGALGWERRERPVEDLASWLLRRAEEQACASGASGPAEAAELEAPGPVEGGA